MPLDILAKLPPPGTPAGFLAWLAVCLALASLAAVLLAVVAAVAYVVSLPRLAREIARQDMMHAAGQPDAADDRRPVELGPPV